MTEKALYVRAKTTVHRYAFRARKWTTFEVIAKRFRTTAFDTLLATTEDERLFISNNGGKKFQEAQLPEPYLLYNFVALSSKLLFAVGHWIILRSDDGGKTWETSKRAGGSAGVYAEVHAFNKDEILATGQWSSCALSVDGGKSWRAHKHPEEFGTIEDLAQLNDGRLFGLTDKGRPAMVVTKNRGRKWTPVNDIRTSVNSIWARSDDALILVGDQGYFEIKVL